MNISHDRDRLDDDERQDAGLDALVILAGSLIGLLALLGWCGLMHLLEVW